MFIFTNNWEISFETLDLIIRIKNCVFCSFDRNSETYQVLCLEL